MAHAVKLQQQLQMCSELLRELWGGSETDTAPPQPHVTDFWLPDFADDNDVPDGVKTKARASPADEVVAAAEADARSDDAAVRSAAASAMRVVCNDLDRRMATDDGDLKAPITTREASVARRAYLVRAAVARRDDAATLALLNACRAVSFGLRNIAAYREALVCAVAAKRPELVEEFARRGVAVARVCSDANEANAFRARAVALLAVSKRGRGDDAETRSSALAKRSPANQVALPAGVRHSREQRPCDLHAKLEHATALLRAAWDADVAMTGQWIPDWLEQADGMGADPARIRELAALSPSQLKDRGNAAWQSFNNAATACAADADAARLCYTSCIAKLDVAACVIDAANTVPGAAERLGVGVEGFGEASSAAIVGPPNAEARRVAAAAYMNRSLVHLRTGRHVEAVLDAVFAALHDVTSLKAHYRGLLSAKAAGDVPLAIRFCQQGLRRGGAEDDAFSAAAADLARTLRER